MLAKMRGRRGAVVDCAWKKEKARGARLAPDSFVGLTNSLLYRVASQECCSALETKFPAVSAVFKCLLAVEAIAGPGHRFKALRIDLFFAEHTLAECPIGDALESFFCQAEKLPDIRRLTKGEFLLIRTCGPVGDIRRVYLGCTALLAAARCERLQLLMPGRQSTLELLELFLIHTSRPRCCIPEARSFVWVSRDGNDAGLGVMRDCDLAVSLSQVARKTKKGAGREARSLLSPVRSVDGFFVRCGSRNLQ